MNADEIRKDPTADGIEAARGAIEVQGQIKTLEAEITRLKALRDEMITEAIRGNVRKYEGWSFIPMEPKREASFSAFLEYDADAADLYSEWYRDNMEIKLTATSLQKFAKAQDMTEEATAALLGAVLKDSGGEATVQLRAPKGAKE